MAFKQGEVYRCPDPECSCEIAVTKAPAPGKGGNQAPRCCCGKEMIKKNQDVGSHTANFGRISRTAA